MYFILQKWLKTDDSSISQQLAGYSLKTISQMLQLTILQARCGKLESWQSSPNVTQ
jgi:hypothetical protein